VRLRQINSARFSHLDKGQGCEWFFVLVWAVKTTVFLAPMGKSTSGRCCHVLLKSISQSTATARTSNENLAVCWSAKFVGPLNEPARLIEDLFVSHFDSLALVLPYPVN
jgi:hypothetical protein